MFYALRRTFRSEPGRWRTFTSGRPASQPASQPAVAVFQGAAYLSFALGQRVRGRAPVSRRRRVMRLLAGWQAGWPLGLLLDRPAGRRARLEQNDLNFLSPAGRRGARTYFISAWKCDPPSGLLFSAAWQVRRPQRAPLASRSPARPLGKRRSTNAACLPASALYGARRPPPQRSAGSLSGRAARITPGGRVASLGLAALWPPARSLAGSLVGLLTWLAGAAQDKQTRAA